MVQRFRKRARKVPGSQNRYQSSRTMRIAFQAMDARPSQTPEALLMNFRLVHFGRGNCNRRRGEKRETSEKIVKNAEDLKKQLLETGFPGALCG